MYDVDHIWNCYSLDIVMIGLSSIKWWDKLPQSPTWKVCINQEYVNAYFFAPNNSNDDLQGIHCFRI